MKILSIAASVALALGSLSAMAEGISQARVQQLGSTATVEGYVTVPSGRFSGFSFDQGFAIEDEQAGIYISVPDNLELSLNDHVKVTGTIVSSYNQLMVSAQGADVEVLATPQRIAPAAMSTGSINNDTEGLLVNVEGTVTTGPIDDMPYGWKFLMDDGSGEITIFIASTVALNPFNVPWLVPGQAVSLTGFSSEFDDHFEINPRRRGDLVKLGK